MNNNRKIYESINESLNAVYLNENSLPSLSAIKNSKISLGRNQINTSFANTSLSNRQTNRPNTLMVLTRTGTVQTRSGNLCGKIGLQSLEYLVSLILLNEVAIDNKGYSIEHEEVGRWVENETEIVGTCENVVENIRDYIANIVETNHDLGVIAAKILLKPDEKYMPERKAYFKAYWFLDSLSNEDRAVITPMFGGPS